MQKLADGHETPSRPVSRAPAGMGGFCNDHDVPFHRSASGRNRPCRSLPTAMHAVGDEHESAARTPPVAGGFGVCWICQPLAAALTGPAALSTPVTSAMVAPSASRAVTGGTECPKALRVNLRRADARIPLLPMCMTPPPD